NDARYNLKIIDNGFPPPRDRDDLPAAADEPAKPTEDNPVDDLPVDKPVTSDPIEELPADVPPEGEPEDVGRAINDDTINHESDRQTLAERTRAELADLDDLDV